jgi:2,5-diketo-D-gluconate reductase B
MPPEPLPDIGLGTMQYDSPDDCIESVEAALEMGYRHIDTAQKYENEAEVGEGIARSSVPREAITLATKVEEDNLTYDDVHRTTDESLERLGVDQVDLLYVHWPAVSYDAEETLAAFNEVAAAGKTRYVGVSNFSPALLDEARDLLDGPIFALQVEMHPLLPQEELQAYAREHDLHLVSYCPLMHGEIFEVPELSAIAEDAGTTIPQLALAWLASKPNVHAIPKATGEAHLRENLAAGELELDDTVLERVDAIEERRRVVDVEKGPWN